ncbi:MAG: carboxypeptidase-like regulatory domain-containing protein, partial [Planctomycetota bacterium]
LRDFADADLSPALHAEVESHVHACRACGLSLSRAEFEVLRLRRAFGDGWVPAAPRSGFARRTLARLLFESPELALEAAAAAEAAEAEAAAAARLDDDDDAVRIPIARRDAPKIDLARRVVARASAELHADQKASIQRTRRWLVYAGLASVLLVAACGLIWQSVVEVTAHVRLSVVTADQVWRSADGNLLCLGPGDGLSEGAVLRIDDEGALDAEWYDASVIGEQPAAQLRLRGGSDLHVEAQLQLLHGSMEVLSQRPMSVLLGDGTIVELGAGLYHISATEQMGPYDDLLASAGRLGVRVEVHRGEVARLDRESGNAAVISAGQVGRYSRGMTGIAVENQPQPVGVGPLAGSSVRNPAEPSEQPDLRGVVLDTFGAPVASASVRVSYPSVTGLVSRQLSTDASGVYELPAGSGVRPGYALLEVAPPEGRVDLAFLPEDARALSAVEDGGFELASATLGRSLLLRGRILGNYHERSHARVLPCLYDEALGQVWPWLDGAVTSDHDGRFVLSGLPTRLPPHQIACVIIYQSQGDVLFQAIPLPDSTAAAASDLRVSLPPLRDLVLRGLPPSRSSVVLEEVAGMPSGSAVRRHVVLADGSGVATGMRVGRGRLWLETGTVVRPMLQPIANAGPGLADVAGEQLERSAALPPFQVVPGIQGNSLEVAVQSRFSDARVEPANGEEMRLQNLYGGQVPKVQVYSLKPRAGGGVHARFLGLSRPDGTLRVGLEVGETEILAFSGDGGVCARVNIASLRNPSRSRLDPLRMPATGTAQLHEVLVPSVHTLMTVWQPLDVGHCGARPIGYRILCSADGWLARDLPAGDYQVLDEVGRSFRVQILAGTTVEIR